MPQKLNKAGKMQDYIPAGNGDPSGEYGTAKGTNKNFTTNDKKKTQANVITENKSVVVGNKKSESKKDYTIKKESFYSKKNDKNFDYDVIDKLPDGWGKIDGALTAPKGYVWVNNKKSLWDKDYQQAIIKKELLETPNKANVIDGDLTGKKNKMGKLIPSSELKMVDLSGKRFKDDDGKWYEVKKGGYGIEHNGRLVSTNSKSSGGSNMPQIYDKKLTQEIINQGLVEFETAYIDEGYDAEQRKRWVESGYEATWDTKPKKNNKK